MIAKVWNVIEFGDPREGMRLETVEVAEPAMVEARVAMDVVGLSHADLNCCLGKNHGVREVPFVPGFEGAGTVEAVGDRVPKDLIGRRVALLSRGLLATHSLHDASELLELPDGLSSTDAAALLNNAFTAWHALYDRGRLGANETLLVLGSAGGAGSAAVQIAKAFGATVLAVAGGQSKCGYAARLGADRVFDHLEGDFRSEVLHATNGRGVDVVFDPVGGPIFDVARRTVAWGGRYLVVGFAAGAIPTLAVNHALLKGYSLVGVNLGQLPSEERGAHQRLFSELVQLHGKGSLSPSVTNVVHFEQAPDAIAGLGDRLRFGKTVVTIPHL